MFNLEKQKKIQERIDKCLKRNDNNFSSKQIDYIRKQENAEKMRKKYFDEKQEKAKKNEILRKKKESEILEVIKRNDEIIQKRIEDYNKKQELIKERQKERDYQISKELKEKHYRLLEKEKKCIETRKKNEKNIEENRQKILDKINSNEDKIKLQKEYNNKISMERYIEEIMRKEDIETNIREKERAQEFLRVKKLIEIEQKKKRIDKLKKIK